MFGYLFGYSNEEKHDGLAFMGGGVLIYAHFGAISALSELGKLNDISHFAGSSAGSIAAMLCSLRITKEKIIDMKDTLNWNLRSLLDGKWSYPGEIYRLIEKLGMHEGLELTNIISQLVEIMSGNKDITFAEAKEKYGTELTVTTTQVYTKFFECIYHNTETNPNSKIVDIIHKSCTYPWVFETEGAICDGGLADNLPIEHLKCKKPLGIAFENPTEIEKVIPKTLTEYSLGIAAGISMRLNKIPDGFDIIKIPTFGIHALDFDITPEKKEILFNAGYQAVKKFFS